MKTLSGISEYQPGDVLLNPQGEVMRGPEWEGYSQIASVLDACPGYRLARLQQGGASDNATIDVPADGPDKP